MTTLPDSSVFYATENLNIAYHCDTVGPLWEIEKSISQIMILKHEERMSQSTLDVVKNDSTLSANEFRKYVQAYRSLMNK